MRERKGISIFFLLALPFTVAGDIGLHENASWANIVLLIGICLGILGLIPEKHLAKIESVKILFSKFFFFLKRHRLIEEDIEN